MNSLFDLGPDALILAEAVLVSAVLAVLPWRGASFGAAAAVTALVAALLPLWSSIRPSPLDHRLMVALFTAVPTALLLGASRARWMARRAWLLVVFGPIVFVGCFVGVCELCAKAGLLS
jgi:hypothetical protein